jgi:hypothetical protein
MDSKTSSNRRVKVERRTAELGPPESVEDRRQQAERRHPQVEHVDFDEHVEMTPAVPELTVG